MFSDQTVSRLLSHLLSDGWLVEDIRSFSNELWLSTSWDSHMWRTPAGISAWHCSHPLLQAGHRNCRTSLLFFYLVQKIVVETVSYFHVKISFAALPLNINWAVEAQTPALGVCAVTSHAECLSFWHVPGARVSCSYFGIFSWNRTRPSCGHTRLEHCFTADCDVLWILSIILFEN